MADVKWIKIVTDVFDDEKILLIESLPESDSLIVIWFKLLCLAGKQNNSGVFLMNNKIPYTEEMLAAIFRRPLSTVKLALKTFEDFGMIEIVDGVITIPNWEKHQSLDQLEMIKEQTRKRVAKHRERQKQKALGISETTEEKECNVTDTLPYAKVTQTDIDIDKNKNRLDKNKEIYIEVIDYLNLKINSNYKSSSKTTQKHINARLSEGFTIDDFKTVIDKKYTEWYGTDMQQYLRPETLFGTKFESYLNAPIKQKGKVEQKPSGNPFFDLLREEGKL